MLMLIDADAVDVPVSLPKWARKEKIPQNKEIIHDYFFGGFAMGPPLRDWVASWPRHCVTGSLVHVHVD